MPIPTKEEIKRKLTPFLQDSNADTQKKASVILDYFTQLEIDAENKIDHVYDEIYQYYLEIVGQNKFNPFEKTLYHTCLYLSYQYPRNQKENDVVMDPITVHTIPEDHLFIALDRWHFDVLALMQWTRIKNKAHQPITNRDLLSEEKYAMNNKVLVRARKSLIKKLMSDDQEQIINGLQFFIDHRDLLSAPSELLGLLDHTNQNIVQLAIDVAINNKIERFNDDCMRVLATLLRHYPHDEAIIKKIDAQLKLYRLSENTAKKLFQEFAIFLPFYRNSNKNYVKLLCSIFYRLHQGVNMTINGEIPLLADETQKKRIEMAFLDGLKYHLLLLDDNMTTDVLLDRLECISTFVHYLDESFCYSVDDYFLNSSSDEKYLLLKYTHHENEAVSAHINHLMKKLDVSRETYELIYDDEFQLEYFSKCIKEARLSFESEAVLMPGKGLKLFSNDGATFEESFSPSQRSNQVFYGSFFQRSKYECKENDVNIGMSLFRNHHS